MKVKFLDVIQMGTHLFKSGEVGEFSHQTAEELIKKGLAVLEGGIESGENPADPPPQASTGSKGGRGGKGKNSTPPKDESGTGGNENNGSENESNNSNDETEKSDDESKSDKNTQATNEDAKPE